MVRQQSARPARRPWTGGREMVDLDFVVEELEIVKLDIAREDGLLAGHDLMSPYVWEDNDCMRLLVRVPPPGLQQATSAIPTTS